MIYLHISHVEAFMDEVLGGEGILTGISRHYTRQDPIPVYVKTHGSHGETGVRFAGKGRRINGHGFALEQWEVSVVARHTYVSRKARKW